MDELHADLLLTSKKTLTPSCSRIMACPAIATTDCMTIDARFINKHKLMSMILSTYVHHELYAVLFMTFFRNDSQLYCI